MSTDTGPFALIPEWVLYAHVSAKAIRLYCTLGRYADKDGDCFPSRRKLAEHLGTSTKTVDRAAAELVAIGAIQREHSYSGNGDQTSNAWKVIRAHSLSRGGDKNGATPGDKNGATPGDKSDALTRTSLNENHIELERARAPKRATSLPNDWKPDGPLIDWAARELDLEHLDLIAETEKFKEHFAATGKLHKDWRAAWRLWMRRAPEFTKGGKR